MHGQQPHSAQTSGHLRCPTGASTHGTAHCCSQKPAGNKGDLCLAHCPKMLGISWLDFGQPPWSLVFRPVADWSRWRQGFSTSHEGRSQEHCCHALMSYFGKLPKVINTDFSSKKRTYQKKLLALMQILTAQSLQDSQPGLQLLKSSTSLWRSVQKAELVSISKKPNLISSMHTPAAGFCAVPHEDGHFPPLNSGVQRPANISLSQAQHYRNREPIKKRN